MSVFNKKLEGYLGCLSHKRTPDEAARRRKSIELDEDGWMILGGNNFSVDASGKLLRAKRSEDSALKPRF